MKAAKNEAAGAAGRRRALSREETKAMAAEAFKNRYVLAADRIYNILSRGEGHGSAPIGLLKRLKEGPPPDGV